MNEFTASHEIYFRSIIQNSLNSDSGQLRLSVESGSGGNIILSLEISEDSNITIANPESEQMIQISAEDALEKTLAALRDNNGALLIESTENIQRIGLKNGSITRETIEDRPRVLKDPAWAVGKAVHLDPHQAAPLLKAIGLMTQDGEIKAPMRKKFKQVNHFLDLLKSSLKTQKKRTLIAVDLGCGKSYLSFVLFWYITKVLKMPARFYGVDIAQDRIDQCNEIAHKLNLKGMKFQCASISEASLPSQVDLLISLHACDTATDEALALGVTKNARHIAVAPCCQHELAKQIDGAPMYPLKHGLFKHRFADLLTDMLRSLFLEAHGYSVTVSEFVSVEETPKNLLIRATKGNSQQKKRIEEYDAFKKYYNVYPMIDMLVQ
jgi:SAM-dependent methyltransferase